MMMTSMMTMMKAMTMMTIIMKMIRMMTLIITIIVASSALPKLRMTVMVTIIVASPALPRVPSDDHDYASLSKRASPQMPFGSLRFGVLP